MDFCLPSCSASCQLVAAALNLNPWAFNQKNNGCCNCSAYLQQDRKTSQNSGTALAWGIVGSLIRPLAFHTVPIQCPCLSHPPAHPPTHGFGRNSKDHNYFMGQPRSSPPWGLWEAESNVGLILEGLVQTRVASGPLRTLPRPPASFIHWSQTPLSGTSLWLGKEEEKHSVKMSVKSVCMMHLAV